MSDHLWERIGHLRIVPVVQVEDPRDGVTLARTLVDSGLPIIEVTLRTPHALAAVEAIASEVPDILVGAGTLLTSAQVAQAASAGAHFGVSPGFTASLSDAAREHNLPFIPGAVTPSEIQSAMEAGHTHLKFFPAEASGGVESLAALAGPFGGTDLSWMPTGGISTTNLSRYLSVPQVFAVGGTWIAPRQQINEGEWSAIGQSATDTVRAIAAFEARTKPGAV